MSWYESIFGLFDASSKIKVSFDFKRKIIIDKKNIRENFHDKHKFWKMSTWGGKQFGVKHEQIILENNSDTNTKPKAKSKKSQSRSTMTSQESKPLKRLLSCSDRKLRSLSTRQVLRMLVTI